MSHMTLVRLMKEQKKLDEQPIPNILVTRQGILNFHFCIYGLQDPYTEGFYHGVLQLHQEYPFKPPTLRFFTPNGRFETNKPICTTFTNFHQESWTSSWNIKTMLIGTVSFMYDTQGGYGGRKDSTKTKRQYAKNSLLFNLKNQQFRKLFASKIQKLGKSIQVNENQQEVRSPNKNINIIYSSLVALVLMYFTYKFTS